MGFRPHWKGMSCYRALRIEAFLFTFFFKRALEEDKLLQNTLEEDKMFQITLEEDKLFQSTLEEDKLLYAALKGDKAWTTFLEGEGLLWANNEEETLII